MLNLKTKSYYLVLITPLDIDDCATNPCLNDGTCADYVNGFDCFCTDGYSGDTCEIGKKLLYRRIKKFIDLVWIRIKIGLL